MSDHQSPARKRRLTLKTLGGSALLGAMCERLSYHWQRPLARATAIPAHAQFSLNIPDIILTTPPPLSSPPPPPPPAPPGSHAFNWQWSHGDYTINGTFITDRQYDDGALISESELDSHIYSVRHTTRGELFRIDLLRGEYLETGTNRLRPLFSVQRFAYHIGNASFTPLEEGIQALQLQLTGFPNNPFTAGLRLDYPCPEDSCPARDLSTPGGWVLSDIDNGLILPGEAGLSITDLVITKA